MILTRKTVSLLLAAGVIVLLILTAKYIGKKTEGPYRADGKPGMEIQAALEQAQQKGQHLLVVFGANWCPWCRALHHLMEENREVHEYLKQNYQVVLVDVGRRDRNMELDSLYGHPVKLGLPALVLLDERGELLTLQETGVFEFSSRESKAHDPEKFLNFLKRWQHPLPEEK